MAPLIFIGRGMIINTDLVRRMENTGSVMFLFLHEMHWKYFRNILFMRTQLTTVSTNTI